MIQQEVSKVDRKSITISFYYIDTDEIPGFFLLLKNHIFIVRSEDTIFISLIRMRSKRDIKMGRLSTPGGAVLGIVGGGVRFRFLNGEAIFEEYMLFWVRLYALVVVLKILLDFSL